MMSSDASCTGCVVEYRGTCTSTSTAVQENVILDHKLGKIWDGAVVAGTSCAVRGISFPPPKMPHGSISYSPHTLCVHVHEPHLP